MRVSTPHGSPTSAAVGAGAAHRDRWFGDWNLRACARHGHTTYAPDEPGLRERLWVQTPAGEAWRCLRCWSYIPGPPAGSGPAARAPEVPRGAVLRDRVIMRALSVERMLRAVLLFLAAYGVHRFESAQQGLVDTANTILPQLSPIFREVGWNIETSRVVQELYHLMTTRPEVLSLVVVFLVVYGVLQVIESVGLWRMERWGEYFAVVATSMFIPLEVYEITQHLTALKALAFAINVAAVVWLVWTKHLFGARGGVRAYEAEREAASLLGLETAAVSAPPREVP